jgi:hypothetical protein
MRCKPAPLTHVAEAITTAPVRWSTAITDQVAKAGLATSRQMLAIRIRRIIGNLLRWCRSRGANTAVIQ